jgi:hypothetical protein
LHQSSFNGSSLSASAFLLPSLQHPVTTAELYSIQVCSLCFSCCGYIVAGIIARLITLNPGLVVGVEARHGRVPFQVSAHSFKWADFVLFVSVTIIIIIIIIDIITRRISCFSFHTCTHRHLTRSKARYFEVPRQMPFASRNSISISISISTAATNRVCAVVCHGSGV